MALVRLPAPILFGVTSPFAQIGGIAGIGHSQSIVGQIHLEYGPGPKTISAAGGGAVLWLSNTPIVFANALTAFRVGVMDTEANGYEDGSPDVSATLVPGVDTITASAWQTTVMTTGSKTVNDGDLIAIQCEMTARGGTDSVPVQRVQGANPFSGPLYTCLPHGVSDTGSGFSKSTLLLCALLRFDDGTYGWMTGHPPAISHNGLLTTLSYSSSTTPDEYGAVFGLSFRAIVSAVLVQLMDPSTGSHCEISVLSNPWGTPAAIPGMPVAYVGEQIWSIGGLFGGGLLTVLPTPLTVEPGVEYVVTQRPTTVTTFGFGVMNVGAGYESLKRTLPFSTLKTVARTDQTGAFAEVQPHYIPGFGLMVSHLEDGL